MTMRSTESGTPEDRLGESPVWSAREGCLYWVDSLAGLLHRLHPESGRREAFPVPAPVGSFGLCRDGGVVLAPARWLLPPRPRHRVQ
jgi:sugar lactone lactonase YvrE